jgi:flagellar assembly factor FliW
VQIDVSRFGLRDLVQGWQLHFPAGLLGFPHRKDYCIQNHGQDVPFKWLQATDDPPLAFVITDPFAFLPDYQVEIQEQDLRELKVTDHRQLMLFVIVTLPGKTSPHLTVNLQGPVLVNRVNGWAKQLVLINSPYHTRHPLLVNHASPL